MKRYIVAIDQGTTSSRALVIDRNGEVLASAGREIRQIYPKEGFIEHDPHELVSSVRKVMDQAVDESGIDVEEIAGIGITNQRETTIVFDKETGEPVANAIVWQCRRTASLCDKLKEEGLEEYVRHNTGLVIDPYFSGTKIAWLLDNVEDARKRAEEGRLGFATVDSWLLYNLTEGKVHKTDMTNASRTMLYNIRELRWDDYLCSKLGIPMSMLPEVVESSTIFGHMNYRGCLIPVGGMAGDQQAALFGQKCFNKGDLKNTYGTGCFLLANTGDRQVVSERGLITTIGISYRGKISYAMEGSIFMGGAIFKWMRDELGLFKDNDEIEGLAREVESSGGAVVMPSFTGLGAPYWDMQARGAIFGLTRGIDKRHIVRAGLEAVALQVEGILSAVRHDAGIELNVLKVDGGASVNGLLLEIQSAVSDILVERAACIESTALGAAYLAGLATGVFKDIDDLPDSRAGDMAFMANMDEGEIERLKNDWEKAVLSVRYYAASN